MLILLTLLSLSWGARPSLQQLSSCADGEAEVCVRMAHAARGAKQYANEQKLRVAACSAGQLDLCPSSWHRCAVGDTASCMDLDRATVYISPPTESPFTIAKRACKAGDETACEGLAGLGLSALQPPPHPERPFYAALEAMVESGGPNSLLGPKGALLVSHESSLTLVTASGDRTTAVAPRGWSPQANLGRWQDDGWLVPMFWMPDDDGLTLPWSSGLAAVWHHTRGPVVAPKSWSARQNCTRPSFEGSRVAQACDGSILLWDIEGSASIYQSPIWNPNPLLAPDGTLYVAASVDGQVASFALPPGSSQFASIPSPRLASGLLFFDAQVTDDGLVIQASVSSGGYRWLSADPAIQRSLTGDHERLRAALEDPASVIRCPPNPELPVVGIELQFVGREVGLLRTGPKRDLCRFERHLLRGCPRYDRDRSALHGPRCRADLPRASADRALTPTEGLSREVMTSWSQTLRNTGWMPTLRPDPSLDAFLVGSTLTCERRAELVRPVQGETRVRGQLIGENGWPVTDDMIVDFSDGSSIEVDDSIDVAGRFELVVPPRTASLRSGPRTFTIPEVGEGEQRDLGVWVCDDDTCRPFEASSSRP